MYLKGVLRKRKDAKLQQSKRLFSPGMRNTYLNKTEVANKLCHERLQYTALQEKMATLKQSEEQWIKELQSSWLNKNETKFIVDCVNLLKSDQYPAQMAILKNLVSKLRQGRNHHFCGLIKEIAKMNKNFLRASNYAVLQVMCSSV